MWILKLKWKQNKEHKSLTFTKLNIQDIDCAENEILKHCQLECFENEFVGLVKGLPLKIGKLIPLSPFFKDGLVHVGGRIGSAAYIPYWSKHQVIVSSNHPIASLLVFYIHSTNFWFSHHSFFYGGNYFGALTIKLNKGTCTSGTAKRYGALFTCMTTWAVHLQLAGDMTTDSFILVLHHFRARMGHPKSNRSDNRSNFIGAEKELKDALSKLDQKEIINELNENQIQWMFNPPKRSWMGVAMEDLVKITKRCLKVLVIYWLLHEDALHTLLLETESIVNNRPLTPVRDDTDDLEPLTPNHFLIGGSSPKTSFVNITEKNVNSHTKWKSEQAVTNMYWKRWIKEYLLLLTLRNNWTKMWEHEDERHSYIWKRKHRRIEIALGKSYKMILWKRWYREVSTVENEGQHTSQACCQTMCN